MIYNKSQVAFKKIILYYNNSKGIYVQKESKSSKVLEKKNDVK